MSVNRFIYIFICLPVCLSVSDCLSIYMSVCLSVCIFVYLSIYLLSTYLSIHYLPIYLSIVLSICLPINEYKSFFVNHVHYYPSSTSLRHWQCVMFSKQFHTVFPQWILAEPFFKGKYVDNTRKDIAKQSHLLLMHVFVLWVKFDSTKSAIYAIVCDQ